MNPVEFAIRARLDDGANPFDMTDALRAVLDLDLHNVRSCEPDYCAQGCHVEQVRRVIAESLGVADES